MVVLMLLLLLLLLVLLHSGQRVLLRVGGRIVMVRVVVERGIDGHGSSSHREERDGEGGNNSDKVRRKGREERKKAGR